MAGGILSFGALAPADLARLLQGVPMAPAQGFGALPQMPSGFSGSAVAPPLAIQPFGALPRPAMAESEAETQRLESGMLPPEPLPLRVSPRAVPQPTAPASLPGRSAPGGAAASVPLPPERPAEFGPRAGDPVEAAAATPATAAAAGQPSGWDRFLNGLGQNSDLLIGLGTGLMTTPGFGQGFARGIQNVTALQNATATQNLAQSKAALDRMKALREFGATNQTAKVIASKLGIPLEQAEAYANNQSFVNEFMKGALPASEQFQTYTDADGRLRQKNVRTGQETILDTGKENLRLVDVPGPGGTTQKVWVKPGESAGVPVGEPANPNAATLAKEEAERAARVQAVKAQGLDPNDPRYRDYVISGRLPREDQQALTAADKKAISEGEEGVLQGRSTIEKLRRALDLSKTAYDGVTAGTRAAVVSNMPGFLGGGDPAALDTMEMEKVIVGQALDSLKATFGGAPTEGERKILLDVQGSVNQPKEVRDRILNEALRMAERRTRFEEDRVNQLRGGTFYKPGGGALPGAQGAAAAPAAPAAPAPAPAPAGAPAAPRAQPRTKADYDALPSGTEFVDPMGTVRIKP